MAVEAELHGKGFVLEDNGHFVDFAVTFYAGDTAIDVD